VIFPDQSDPDIEIGEEIRVWGIRNSAKTRIQYAYGIICPMNEAFFQQITI
jgi:hypothetical protein